jgi:tetratricopeptide (TPR) repeat protein
VGAFYWTRPSPGNALFQQYFDPYPSTRPALRGITEGRPAALALYEARDYRGALPLLESSAVSDPKDATALFYLGLSHLALGHDRQAALALEQVLRLGDDDLSAPAAWYLALAHLRRGDLGPARSRLEHIATTEGFYRDKARTLLAEVDRLDRGK